MSKIILTVDNQTVYDSTKQNTGDSNNLTNNSVRIEDLKEVSNPQVMNDYFYVSNDRDEDNKYIIKYGVLTDIKQEQTGIHEYTKYYTIDGKENIEKLYKKKLGGGQNANRAENPTKRKQDETAENPFVAIVVIKELFYYKK